MRTNLLQLILQSWSVPFWPTLLTPLTAWVYLRGWRVARLTRPRELPPWRAACFVAGLFTIWVALASPIDALDSFLILAHMTQHLLLISLAPPLLLAGRPVVPLLRGLPRAFVRHDLAPWMNSRAFRFLQRLFTNPFFSWFTFVGAIVLWHLPAAYELTLRSTFWHQFEHGCFFFSALAFWWYLIRPWPSHVRGSHWLILPYMVAANCALGTVGMVITLSGSVIYTSYAMMPRVFDLSTLSDQGLAGNEMLFVGLIVILAVLYPILFDLVAEPADRPARTVESFRPKVFPLQWEQRDVVSVPHWLTRWPYKRHATYAAVIFVISGLTIFGLNTGDSDDNAQLYFRQPAGPFILSLFAPDPLTAGDTDFSVAVENPNGEGLVPDASVSLTLTSPEGGRPLIVPTTHEGSSKFLNSARVTLPRRGNWHVAITAKRGHEGAHYSTLLHVRPAAPNSSDRIWDVVAVGIVLLLFGIHQWQRRIYQRRLRTLTDTERQASPAIAA